MDDPLTFVVLHHTGHGPDHYDLMLAVDADGPLPTWRLPAWPPRPGDAAVPLPPHRRHFLTYEGDVSGDRGRVRRVADGSCVVRTTDAASWSVELDGHLLDLPRPH